MENSKLNQKVEDHFKIHSLNSANVFFDGKSRKDDMPYIRPRKLCDTFTSEIMPENICINENVFGEISVCSDNVFKIEIWGETYDNNFLKKLIIQYVDKSTLQINFKKEEYNGDPLKLKICIPSNVNVLDITSNCFMLYFEKGIVIKDLNIHAKSATILVNSICRNCSISTTSGDVTICTKEYNIEDLENSNFDIVNCAGQTRIITK